MPQSSQSSRPRTAPFFWTATVSEFLAKPDETILGEIVAANTFDLTQDQRNAWLAEIALLKKILPPHEGRGNVFFEFSIPRMGRRADVVLLLDGVVFVLEFKVGADDFFAADTEQTWDYALDMKNFHRESHALSVVPILIATEAKRVPVRQEFFVYEDKVFRPLFASAQTLAETLDAALAHAERRKNFDVHAWRTSAYFPTPTIIEAARALYAEHSVAEITRSDAAAKNISETCEEISKIISACKTNREKAICFVTGVPGAGKTLVGLNVATQESGSGLPAVYLSGNKPLVDVLTEALARDKVRREQERYEAKKRAGTPNPQRPCTKKSAMSEAKAFIQLVHHYRDAGLVGTKIEDGEIIADAAFFLSEKNRDKNFVPAEHVAIFDEAQRAWTHQQLAGWLKRKKGLGNFPCSEPAFLCSCLDRHKDWAVVVCLVGGGQEINTGEAGIAEWIRALNERFPYWRVFISPRLEEQEYADGKTGEMLSARENVKTLDALHLAVSVRSFRAENLSAFVHALLDFEAEKARERFAELREKYPIALTRDLTKAKRWLRERARGSERCGMLVSSKAERLRPLAIDVRCKPNVVCWFLNDDKDVCSSNFLEAAAREFDVQGLEVDWACVVWDADFRCSLARGSAPAWEHFQFKGGERWNRIRQKEAQAYQKNAYRVLLTRARQGMVICVPAGDAEDDTRRPEFYDATYEYLRSLGIEEI